MDFFAGKEAEMIIERGGQPFMGGVSKGRTGGSQAVADAEPPFYGFLSNKGAMYGALFTVGMKQNLFMDRYPR